jgi:hypothetical protein
MSPFVLLFRRIFATDPDTPKRRTLVVATEARTLAVGAESRTLVVEARK